MVLIAVLGKNIAAGTVGCGKCIFFDTFALCQIF